LEVLAAAVAGDARLVENLASELAKEVVAVPEVVRAMRVLSGGEHSMAAAIELAKMVVRARQGVGEVGS
jgi:fructose-bisphosphate aldolase class 1